MDLSQKLLLLLVMLTIFVHMTNDNDNATNETRSVCLQLPGSLMDRIRAIQPKVGVALGLRTKAPQYAVISEAVTLLEKKVGK